MNTDTLLPDSSNLVSYSAMIITYDLDSSIVILNDSAYISYRDIQLFSDSAYYYINKKTLEAFGLCRLKQIDDSIKGSHLKYNLETKKAAMDTGKTQIDKGFIEGKKIYWVSEKVINAYDGKYTTCSDSPPHYYFYAPKMKVYLGDMVIARPIYLYIYEIPMIMAPFWFVPISSKRKSGLLPFKAGNSNIYGKFIRGFAYYHVLSDYADWTLQIDAMEKKGIMPHLEGVWDYDPYSVGSFHINYIKEIDTKLTRYSIETRNNSSYFLLGSKMNCDIKYMSDNKYRSDYAETTIIWVDKEIASQLTLNRDFGEIRNILTLERAEDFGDTTTFEKLPYFTITTPSKTLLSLLNYSLAGHIVYERQFTPQNQIKAGGANIHSSPSFKQNVLGLFSLSPGIDFDLAVFDKDSLGNKFPSRVGYSFTANANTNLYRVFTPGLLNIKGILHKVIPGISYRYTPDFDFGRFPSVYGIPSYSKTNSIGFMINQEFEAKVGENNEKKNFAQIALGSGYNLLNDSISPLNYSINLPLNPFPKPITKFDTRISGSYNIYTKDYTYTIDQGIGFTTETFKINLTQSYTEEGKYQVAFYGEIKPTRHWLINYGARYDKDLKKFVDYNITLTRDLHCWEGVFSFAQFENNWRYDFKVRIKEIPEVAIGRGLLGYLIE